MGQHTRKFALFLTVLALRHSAQAQLTNQTPFTASFVDDDFRTGWHELNVGAGTLLSNVIKGPKRPLLDYALVYVQPAYTLTEPSGSGIFRGSLQFAPEISGAYMYRGQGSYVASATFWFRYNFVPPNWRLVPYLQGGFGASVLDIPENFDGKSFNYNLDAAAGLRYFICPKCSLNAEYRFQHISNANMWMRNIGVNTTGPAIGVSMFF